MRLRPASRSRARSDEPDHAASPRRRVCSPRRIREVVAWIGDLPHRASRTMPPDASDEDRMSPD